MRKPPGLRIVMKIGKPILIVVMLLPFLVQLSYALEPKETKRILVLYSEDKAHPAHEMTDRGIREAFRSNKLFDIQLYTEHLDLSRFRQTEHFRTLVDYLHRKYAGLEIDVIIGVYPAAVEVILGEAQAAFAGVPIVAC